MALKKPEPKRDLNLHPITDEEFEAFLREEKMDQARMIRGFNAMAKKPRKAE